jgi:EF-hand domain-containing family member B
LGKSTKVGLRNVDNTGRAFGTPSIRSDVPAPKNKSIADNQNYGNEPNAAGVIQPPKFAPIGVFDEDLLSVLSKEDIKDIVNDAGWGLTDEKFEECYAQAAQMHPSGKVSLEMFRRVYFASL